MIAFLLGTIIGVLLAHSKWFPSIGKILYPLAIKMVKLSKSTCELDIRKNGYVKTHLKIDGIEYFFFVPYNAVLAEKMKNLEFRGFYSSQDCGILRLYPGTQLMVNPSLLGYSHISVYDIITDQTKTITPDNYHQFTELIIQSSSDNSK